MEEVQMVSFVLILKKMQRKFTFSEAEYVTWQKTLQPKNSEKEELLRITFCKNSFNSKVVFSKYWSKVVNFPQNWKITDQIFAAPRSLQNTNTVWDTSVNLFLKHIKSEM